MRKRRIICGLLAISIVAILSACGIKFTANDDKALSYLQKKYGTQFAIDGYCSSYNGKDVDRAQMIVHPTNDKDKPFIVRRVKIGTGTEISYDDDYSCRLIEPMINKTLKDTLGNDFPNIKCASYVSIGDYQKCNDYTNKIDYDTFIKDQGMSGSIEIMAVVNYGDAFDKNTAAKQAYAFMKKIVDSKLVKTPIPLEVSFFFVKSGDFSKISPEAIAYRRNKPMMNSKWLNKNDDTTRKYVDASFTLESDNGLIYNQDINEVMKKLY